MPQAQANPRKHARRWSIRRKLAKWKVCRVFVHVCVWWLKSEMSGYKNILNTSPSVFLQFSCGHLYRLVQACTSSKSWKSARKTSYVRFSTSLISFCTTSYDKPTRRRIKKFKSRDNHIKCIYYTHGPPSSSPALVVATLIVAAARAHTCHCCPPSSSPPMRCIHAHRCCQCIASTLIEAHTCFCSCCALVVIAPAIVIAACTLVLIAAPTCCPLLLPLIGCLD